MEHDPSPLERDVNSNTLGIFDFSNIWISYSEDDPEEKAEEVELALNPETHEEEDITSP